MFRALLLRPCRPAIPLLGGGLGGRLGAAEDCESTQAIGCAEANVSVVDGRLVQPGCLHAYI